MIRQVVNGISSAEPDACYCVQDGSTKRGEKIYVVKNGEAKLCWDRPGSRSNPYLISKAEDLAKVKRDPAGYYLVTNFIYLSQEDVDKYFPVLWEEPFTGVFDGGGKAFILVTGAQNPLVVDMNGKQVIESLPNGTSKYRFSCGLFGVNEGIITRLDLSRLRFKFPSNPVTHYQSIIAGVNRGVIDRVIINSENYIGLANGHQSGGISGVNTGTIQFCQNSRNGSYGSNFNGCMAGIVYHNYGAVLNCCVDQYTIPITSASAFYVGAIAYYGQKDSLVKDCLYCYSGKACNPIYSSSGKVENVQKVNSLYNFPKIDFSAIIY